MIPCDDFLTSLISSVAGKQTFLLLATIDCTNVYSLRKSVRELDGLVGFTSQVDMHNCSSLRCAF